jgi:two-component system, LytTR family, sensor kinase
MYRLLLRLLAYLALWTAVGALFAAQATISYTYAGNRTVPAWRILLFSLADWYVWAALAPAIFWLARRFSFTRRRWLSAAVHVPASVVFVVARMGIRLLIGTLIPSLRVNPQGMTATLGLHIFAYWAILAVAVAFAYQRMYREEQLSASALKAQLARAELGLLKMQLHPHFLFNTLNAISEQVHTDPGAAERMITQLSELLRHTIRSGSAHEVSLREEVELLERYLSIQRVRFGSRLRVEMTVEPAVMDALVPNLVLQPLVENAIQHGLAPRASGGQIEISGRREAGDSRERLVLEVSDDGIGVEAARQRRKAAGVEARDGVGIANTVARLEQLYSGDYTFTLRSRTGGGTVATLRVPLRVVAADALVPEVRVPEGQVYAKRPEAPHGA